MCGSEFVERSGHLRCGCGRILDYLLCGSKCIRICLPRISRVVVLVELLTLNSGDLVGKRLALLIGGRRNRSLGLSYRDFDGRGLVLVNRGGGGDGRRTFGNGGHLAILVHSSDLRVGGLPGHGLGRITGHLHLGRQLGSITSDQRQLAILDTITGDGNGIHRRSRGRGHGFALAEIDVGVVGLISGGILRIEVHVSVVVSGELHLHLVLVGVGAPHRVLVGLRVAGRAGGVQHTGHAGACGTVISGERDDHIVAVLALLLSGDHRHVGVDLDGLGDLAAVVVFIGGTGGNGHGTLRGHADRALATGPLALADLVLDRLYRHGGDAALRGDGELRGSGVPAGAGGRGVEIDSNNRLGFRVGRRDDEERAFRLDIADTLDRAFHEADLFGFSILGGRDTVPSHFVTRLDRAVSVGQRHGILQYRLDTGSGDGGDVLRVGHLGVELVVDTNSGRRLTGRNFDVVIGTGSSSALDFGGSTSCSISVGRNGFPSHWNLNAGTILRCRPHFCRQLRGRVHARRGAHGNLLHV